MKKLKGVFVLFLLSIAMLIHGCTNPQASSMEEAKYVVENLPDCEKITNYLNISSGECFGLCLHTQFGIDGLGLGPSDPFLCSSDPEIAKKDPYKGPVVIHEIIYKKKGKSEFCLVLLNDDKPPKIVKKIDIGDKPPVSPKKSKK